MEILMKKLEELKPYENNPKAHPQEQVDNIAESIINYGFVVPIVIDKNGEIVAGHGRYLAAQTLKKKEVPCVMVENLTQEQVDGLRIADNKVAESSWDRDKLKIELDKLDIEIFTGYSLADRELTINPAELTTKPDRSESAPVISYTLIFEDEEQQEQWFKFLKHVKDAYPDEETTAAKVIAFLNDNAEI